jgi:hypothetical protein
MTEWFDISSNRISSIPETFSSVLYPQTVFLLGQNPFKCTCEQLWLKDLFSTRQYLLNYVDRLDPQKFIPVCSSPSNVAGKSWDSLEDNDFECIGLDESNSKSTNERTPFSNKFQEEIEVKVSEIGQNWVVLNWNGNSDVSDKVIQIKYHKFGSKNDMKEVVLPISAGGYRLRNLEYSSPYIICFTVMLGTDSYSLGCEEIVTAKTSDPWSFGHLYRFVIIVLCDYSNHLVIFIFLFLTTFYLIQKKEANKDNETYLKVILIFFHA